MKCPISLCAVLALLANLSCANAPPNAPAGLGGSEAEGGGSGKPGAHQGDNEGGSAGRAPGSGGAPSGSGGADEAGGAPGSGGSVAASGGAAAGGTSAGDEGGAGGGPQADAAVADAPVMGGDLTSIVGKFKGALLTFPCGGSATGFDCANVGCTNRQVTKTTVFKVEGKAGTVYDLTFRVRGVVEGYQYEGGKRDQGSASHINNPDLFYQGGQAKAAGATGSDYNTYQLTVSPPVAGAPNTYFLNSLAVNPRDPSAVHLTFVVDSTKTIKISGGGTITFSTFDSNCRTVMNCEKSSQNNCASHWVVPLTGGGSPPPAGFMQPFQMPTGQYGQWIFFDVLKVAVAQ
jgi:hypothetical protein